MKNLKALQKTLLLTIFSAVLPLSLSAAKAKQKELPVGVLYRMDTKGNVVATPISKELAAEHNLGAKKLTDADFQKIEKLDTAKTLPKGVALKANRRASSKDEFNDADAKGKPALYFSFGFGRPYWGRPYYNYGYNYTPYYYGGYYAPRVLYVGDYCYNPWFNRPYYSGTYYYSYYSYGYC